MSKVEPRIVIVTGGGSGIGRGVAKAFVDQEDFVHILGRNPETLQQTARLLGDRCAWHQADVSKLEQVSAAVTAVVDRHQKIDILINAAGFPLWFTTDTPIEEAEKLWDDVVDVNLKGTFLTSMAVAAHLSRPGGRIINISTNAAFTGGGQPGYLAYSAAKAGVHGLTYALARELSPQGITVNAIAPGLIENTGITNAWEETTHREIVAKTPVGRAGTVEDVAAAALYLASSQASFITGEILNLNGGLVFGR